MHKPTPEQADIINMAVNTKVSLLISALAGTAKTTTLEMIAHAMPVQAILSIAFNKPVADTMAKRLPGHCLSRTINSVGHRAWQPVISRKLVLEKNKTYKIIDSIVSGLSKAAQEEVKDALPDIRKAVSRAKLSGYIPPKIYSHVDRLTEKLEDAAADWDMHENIIGEYGWLIDAALKESIKQAYDGLIDYDDQIYMPTLFGGKFPRFRLVMIDEAQDMSRLNQAMIRKLVTDRLIAVGDDNQSMYAFRGAMRGGMARLKRDFDLHEMHLSISFRCPRAVIQNARWRAPRMMWPEWAKEGLVEELSEWGADQVPDNAAIICRNNAPLFKVALGLLKRGRGVKMIGFDVGPQLVRILKKLGPIEMSQAQVLDCIDEWEAKALAKNHQDGKKADNITDRAECLRVFAYNGANLDIAIAYADGLFKTTGPIQLLSGHKSKGLEWDTVFHLDPWRIPSKWATSREDKEQELNIRYVVETRPKDSLYLVNTKDFT